MRPNIVFEKIAVAATALVLSGCGGFQALNLSSENVIGSSYKAGLTVNAGADQVHESVPSTGKLVTMSGSVQVQNHNVVLRSYAWRLNGQILTQSASPSVLATSFNLLPGTHNIALEVTDGRGRVFGDYIVVTMRSVSVSNTPTPTPTPTPTSTSTPTPTPTPTSTPTPTPSPSPTPNTAARYAPLSYDFPLVYNTIRNPGFEVNGAWFYSGSVRNPSTGAMILTTTQQHSGAQAVFINGGVGELFQELFFRLQLGGSYSLKFFGLVGSTAEVATVTVRFESTPVNGARPVISSVTARVTSTSHQIYTLNFTVPIGADRAKLVVRKEAGTSYAVFDDFDIMQTNVLPEPAPVLMPARNPASTLPQAGDIRHISGAEAGYDPMTQIASGTVPWLANDSEDDNVGAFRFICGSSHEAYDDPIVYPGKPGASHLHQFFGNTKANAFSTYESLRKTGDSTCGSLVNRSAYWIPAMMNGKGKVVRPDHISIYYKRLPFTDKACTQSGGACVDLPAGLRMVFGADMMGNNNYVGYFNCDAKDWKNPPPGIKPGHYPSIIEAAKNCPLGGSGARLGFVINAPSCWDGINLDSPDHRSHLSLPVYKTYGPCPSSHPYIIPSFTLGAWYTIDADLHAHISSLGTWTGQYNGWHLSSDTMNRVEPGKTIHADWFGAWDELIMDMWTDNCINNHLNCSGGNLGNGYGIRGASQPYPNVYRPDLWSWDEPAETRLVDPPPMPVTMDHSAMSH